jgi:hypothetical protein
MLLFIHGCYAKIIIMNSETFFQNCPKTMKQIPKSNAGNLKHQLILLGPVIGRSFFSRSSFH